MKDAAVPLVVEAGPALQISATRTTAWRTAEKVIFAYFVYTALLASFRSVSPLRCLIAWAIPALLWAAIAAESRYSAGWTRVTRDWAALGLILIAYREVDLFAGQPVLTSWQQTWIQWDRFLLGDVGLRSGLERFGSVIPSWLEATYLFLYAVPATYLGTLYLHRRRDQVDRFLTTLFLGTLTAYAALPLFPTIAPRIAFPQQDLPSYSSIWRSANLWLLNHCDIATSVFPSGHVAVAVSAASGLCRTLTGRRWILGAAWLVATLVFTATVYGRYHYAADGLASISIGLIAWRGSEVLERYV